MPEKPSIFLKRYTPITIHALGGTHYIDVCSYLSGEPRQKKYNKAALNDLSRFLKKKDRYKNGANGADRHTWNSTTGLTAFGLVDFDYFVPWLSVNISWNQLQLGFYGKGTPQTMRKILQVIDFYLRTAEIKLSRVYWSQVMELQEYAKYYLGMDCNGFTGAYLETHYPALGINGGDHINFLDGKLKKRKEINEVRPGDILSREGGGGTRHVAMIDEVHGYPSANADSVSVSVSQSAFSLGGLKTKTYKLRKLNNNTLKWHLQGYLKFNHVLGTVKK